MEFVALRHEWVRSVFGIDPDHLLMETAVGESMLPGIQDGDLLLLDATDNRFRAFGVYVLEIAGERLVKRVQPKLDGSLTLISDNAAYEAEHIPPAQACGHPCRRPGALDLRAAARITMTREAAHPRVNARSRGPMTSRPLVTRAAQAPAPPPIAAPTSGLPPVARRAIRGAAAAGADRGRATRPARSRAAVSTSRQALRP